MIIYLYIKTHNQTGLKYLGKTHSPDPYKYPGSGLYWTRHLKEHGNDVTTEILKECSSPEEIKYWGLYYSELWNIVDARDEHGRKLWANLRPEEGIGGWGGKQNPDYDPENISRKRERMLGENNPARNPQTVEKIKNNTKTAMNSPTIRARHLAGLAKESWRIARKNRVGSKAPNYDPSIFTFVHEDGKIEHCTKHELREKYGKNINSHKLANNQCKTSRGRRLLK